MIPLEPTAYQVGVSEQKHMVSSHQGIEQREACTHSYSGL
jgi:hypothetical protein